MTVKEYVAHLLTLPQDLPMFKFKEHQYFWTSEVNLPEVLKPNSDNNLNQFGIPEDVKEFVQI